MARKKKNPSDPANKWSQPEQPPPPLFLGKKERDLTKQINDELIERVIGQTLIYFPLNIFRKKELVRNYVLHLLK